ncbi:hypothetical protein KDX16_28685 [Burkholderia vietnamiensis]|uniref:hypothetical protein n=1 Tax=Burkholderia vietnamiensis TaxID=60552 RepID=UPI001B8E5D70|nr:hypothetical protein [Burkholderia vietnamiensis]MBR7919778.1 hypothetical protein [Burkholderia vietnamiensis]
MTAYAAVNGDIAELDLIIAALCMAAKAAVGVMSMRLYEKQRDNSSGKQSRHGL